MAQTLFQSFIDPDEWETARWIATAFLHDPEGKARPMMGLVFERIDAGRRIFEAWTERLGARDRYEELRVAIIEGDVLGETAGYSVHISSDPLNTERRLKADGASFDWNRAILVSQFNRMMPSPGSPHLAQFKTDLKKFNRYSLIPVSASGQPMLDCAIEKNEIHFRQASELTKAEVEAVVLPVNSFGSESIQ